MAHRRLVDRAVAAWLLVLAGPVAAQAQANIEMHRTEVRQTDGQGGYPARSTRGRFFVISPIPFNDYSFTVDDQKIGPMVVHGIGSRMGQHEFGVIKFERTARMKDIDLRTFIQDLAQKRGIPVPDLPIGHSGTEEFVRAELRGPKQSAITRVSKTPDSVFNIVCEFPTSEIETWRPLCDRSIASFRPEAP
ncbi:hypothetical protein [Labrys neptuniae]